MLVDFVGGGVCEVVLLGGGVFGVATCEVPFLSRKSKSIFKCSLSFFIDFMRGYSTLELTREVQRHSVPTFQPSQTENQKRVLLDSKIDFEQKLKDFERNGNRWLELCRAFIKDANQAEIVASGENLEAKRDFLLKVGSNPRLRARALSATPKKSFALLADFPYSARSAPLGSKNSEGYLSLLAASVANLPR